MEAFSPGDRVRVTKDIPHLVNNGFSIPLGTTGTVVKAFAQWGALYAVYNVLLDEMTDDCLLLCTEIEPLSEET